MSEKKLADIIRVLKIRAVVQNYKNNELFEDDIASLQEIAGYANENNNFVLDELNSHEEINLILNSQSQVTD